MLVIDHYKITCFCEKQTFSITNITIVFLFGWPMCYPHGRFKIFEPKGSFELSFFFKLSSIDLTDRVQMTRLEWILLLTV